MCVSFIPAVANHSTINTQAIDNQTNIQEELVSLHLDMIRNSPRNTLLRTSERVKMERKIHPGL